MSSRQGQRGSFDNVRGCDIDYRIPVSSRRPLSYTVISTWKCSAEKGDWGELTLIRFDRACLKNEYTFMWKCHFSLTALFEGSAEKHNVTFFVWRAALWKRETVCDIVYRSIDPQSVVKKTYVYRDRQTQNVQRKHLSKNLFPQRN